MKLEGRVGIEPTGLDGPSTDDDLVACHRHSQDCYLGLVPDCLSVASTGHGLPESHYTMRNPSARILNQPCVVYSAIRGQDTTGGVQYTYSDSASQVLICSAQPHEYEEVYEGERITQVRHWRFMFAANPSVRPRDKVMWNDSSGGSHIGFVQTFRDEAGRGAAWTARVIEKL